MIRRLNDVMVAQFKQNEADGTSSVNWENSIGCILPEVTTDATNGQILCRGRNLITPSEMIVSPITESGLSTWTSKQLGKYLLPPGDYSICAKYRQLGDVTTVSISIRDYDTISTSYGERPNSDESGTLLRAFTIPEGSRGCTVYLYSNLSANSLATNCEFYDIMLVRGTYTASTMPGFEEYYAGGSASLPLSEQPLFVQPSGFGQIIVAGSMISDDQINVKYITHS